MDYVVKPRQTATTSVYILTSQRVALVPCERSPNHIHPTLIWSDKQTSSHEFHVGSHWKSRRKSRATAGPVLDLVRLLGAPDGPPPTP